MSFRELVSGGLGTSLRSWARALQRNLCTSLSHRHGQPTTPRPLDEVATESASARLKPDGSTGEQRLGPRLAKAVLRQVKISHRKLNVVCRLIRRLSVQEAERQLSVCQKKGARFLLELLRQAKANASHNHQMNLDRVFVRESYVGKGECFKILRPWHGKGRFAFHEKKYSHATIVLEERDVPPSPVPDQGPSKPTFSRSVRRKATEAVRPLPPLPAVWSMTVDPAGIYRKQAQEQGQDRYGDARTSTTAHT
jgi:large subunit ribosomal protein L22